MPIAVATSGSRAVLTLNGPQTGMGRLRKIEFCNTCFFCATCAQCIVTRVLQKELDSDMHCALRYVRWKLQNVR